MRILSLPSAPPARHTKSKMPATRRHRSARSRSKSPRPTPKAGTKGTQSPKGKKATSKRLSTRRMRSKSPAPAVARKRRTDSDSGRGSGPGSDTAASTNTPGQESNPNWRKDASNILLLFVLYTLQGVPMGLSASVPMLLVEKGASYSQQAMLRWPDGRYSPSQAPDRCSAWARCRMAVRRRPTQRARNGCPCQQRTKPDRSSMRQRTQAR